MSEGYAVFPTASLYGAPSVQLLHTQNIHIHTTQLGIDNVDILTYTHVCPNVSSYGR